MYFLTVVEAKKFQTMNILGKDTKSAYNHFSHLFLFANHDVKLDVPWFCLIVHLLIYTYNPFYSATVGHISISRYFQSFDESLTPLRNQWNL